jgi:hypothetical protein
LAVGTGVAVGAAAASAGNDGDGGDTYVTNQYYQGQNPNDQGYAPYPAYGPAYGPQYQE